MSENNSERQLTPVVRWLILALMPMNTKRRVGAAGFVSARGSRRLEETAIDSLRWQQRLLVAPVLAAAVLVLAATPAVGSNVSPVEPDPAVVQEGSEDPALNADIPYQIGLTDQVDGPMSRDAEAGEHEVVLRGVDLHGDPGGFDVLMVDQDTGMTVPFAPTGDGAVAGVAPEGEYLLLVLIVTGEDPFDPDDLALYADPALMIAADYELTVDAREATEVRASGPSDDATLYHNRLAVTADIAGSPQHVAVLNGSPDRSLRAFPSRHTDRAFHFVYMESEIDTLDTGAARDAYHLLFPTTGRIPDDLEFTATSDSLAQLDATYASQGIAAASLGVHQELFRHQNLPFAYTIAHPVEVPGKTRVFMTAGDEIGRTGSFFYDDASSGRNVFEQQFGLRTFQPGQEYAEAWNLPAFGPAVEVTQVGEELLALTTPAETGQPDRHNLGSNTLDGISGELTLWRNGRRLGVGESPLFGVWTVRPEQATYRLDYTYERDVPWSSYATGVEATWTFNSEAGDQFDLQHLMQARVTGNFDDQGRAPAGRLFPLDVHIQRAPDGTAIDRIRARVSYDDGTKWRSIALVPKDGDHWTGLVRHPQRHNGYVALEITAEDGSGNSLTQTVTRAYGLR